MRRPFERRKAKPSAMPMRLSPGPLVRGSRPDGPAAHAPVDGGLVRSGSCVARGLMGLVPYHGKWDRDASGPRRQPPRPPAAAGVQVTGM